MEKTPASVTEEGKSSAEQITPNNRFNRKPRFDPATFQPPKSFEYFCPDGRSLSLNG